MKIARILPALVATALALASCATVNRLDEYRFDDAALAAEMRTPPEPTLDIFYQITISSKNPVGTLLSIGSNIIKASEAERIEGRMREALAAVDVPAIVLRESSAACANALGARRVDDAQDADYLISLDIREYGIEADSPFSEVSLHLRLTASLFSRRGRELVWRRDLSINDPVTPAIFGVPTVIDNLVTAGALASLSTEELEIGFRNVAIASARSLARRLERDLDESRGW